jgi:hypothetical protein
MSIEEICMTFGTYSIASYLPETLRRVDLKLLPTQESRDEALKAAACSILEQRREDQAMERDGALYDSIRRHIDLQFAHAQNLVEWCRLVGSSNARSNTEKLERHRREHRAGPAYHLECLLKLNRECMLDFLHEIYSRELEARGAAGEVSTAINTPVTHALHHFGKVFPYLSETLGGVNPKLLPTQESRDEALTAAICHALKLCSGIDRGKWVCVPLS